MEFNESQFLIETIVPKNELIISRTDLKGNITYVNDTFAQISGYTKEELIGKSHNIVRHPDMPKKIYKQMWNELIKNNKWEGIIKNLRKDKGFYWVEAHISGLFVDGVLTEFKSVRTPIDYETKLATQILYDDIRSLDKENIRKVIYS